VLLVVASAHGLAQVQITSPREHFGFSIGDDYHLATYTQFDDYWHKLAAESPRMVLEDIGPTAEGRRQLMAIVTSPDNHQNLDRYRDISRRLALAEGLTDEEAQELAKQGRAVVWIDGGLHGSEVLGAHQLIEMSYQMVSRTDEETMRFLDNVIVLLTQANPDGMEIVSGWYMRETDPTKRSTDDLPRLYHKYVGHDNNRDSYMVSQPETENMARILYREWMPQIMYNHHQTGPAGTVMWAPPFRGPFNYNFDPLLIMSIEMAGNAMHYRFVAEDKPGTTLRHGGPFSTWWNGGLRTTAYFHNIIGLLTETIGNPTPMEIPFVPGRQLPTLDAPYPIGPQEWHFRQSVDYSITANRAIVDFASRYRETLLYNIYQMGRNAIERGSRDNWTLHPKRMDRLMATLDEDGAIPELPAMFGALAGYFLPGVPNEYFDQLRKQDERDPRGYILPANQPDFLTATKFVNALIKNGVTIHRATRDFDVSGTEYPAGSYVVLAAQAFRPHVMDMFEPQDHPNDFVYEGAAPTPPYDNAGWTLAYQMGVEFDRILDGLEGPFEKIDGFAVAPAGTVAGPSNPAGFVLSHQVNDAARVSNRLLAAGQDVFWLSQPISSNGVEYPAGSLYIPGNGSGIQIVQRAATDIGLKFDGLRTAPSGNALKLNPVRIGLWDEYGGSMPSGWTRWLMEQFEFPFEVVYPQALDEGDLARRFDVLVFVTGGIPASDGEDDPMARMFGGGQPDPETIPNEYRDWLGSVTVASTLPLLMEFLEQGGTIITIGSSTVMARHAGLPIENHLVDDKGNPLTPDKYYVPGSVLQVRVDNSRPLAYGIGERVDVFFNNSPVMRLLPVAHSAGVTPVAWFDTAEPLRSGWAWGQHRLNGGVAIAEAEVGQGKLYLFGPEILNRGQPHGTFKFFFNAVYLAGTEEVVLGR
jgi:hypothetical protein